MNETSAGHPLALAIDVGGTSIKAEITDNAGRTVTSARTETPRGEAAREAIGRLGAELLARLSPGDRRRVVGAGVVVPGIVDAERGIGLFSANIGWRDLPLAGPLGELWGVSTQVAHDVSAAGWAEWQRGAGSGVDDVAFVVLGTGVAATFVSGGRLITGGTAQAGELGHVVVRPDGPACGCGAHGCLETVASATAVARRYAELSGDLAAGAHDVVARLGSDPHAQRAWSEAIDALADGLAIVVNLLAPTVVVLGGGLAQAGDALTTPLHKAIAARTFLAPAPELRTAAFGPRAGVVGAALLAVRGEMGTRVSAEQVTYLRGRLVLPDVVVEDGLVEVVGDTLGYVGPIAEWKATSTTTTPEHRGTILPGLIDIHCHGGGGASFPDLDRDGAEAVARHHLERGTTSMLASLVSAPPDDLRRGVATIADLVAADGPVVGAHLEGPFLAAGHCGAHDPAHLAAPDADLTRDWIEAARGTLAMVTLAPELPDAAEVAALLAERGVVVAYGHTDADFADFDRALAAAGPAAHVTHLFNAMAPMHHRAPGPVAASLGRLAGGSATVELIADGVHLDNAIVRMAFDVNPAGVVLVSDAMAAAGMPDGDYDLGPMRVTVADGVARTQGPVGSIAGGTAHLADIVRNCVRAGVDPVDVVAAASSTPARVLGIGDRVGALSTTLSADLLVIDDGWRVDAVMKAGRWVSGDRGSGQ